MNGCIYRTKDGECELWEKDRNCTAFCHPSCENRHPSNADRIRSMGDEELADFLGFVAQDAFCYGRGMREKMLVYPFDTHESTLDWLKQEATE